ncbi:Hyalin [Apostichopus japonicus]|uniref:Hyalin n=1 Tax=Stichopus japonicus TaxID=307972 RepID=A0A2G8KIS0_STIJA|nr:Hyalin [Apostichopus japonicus]
MLKLFPRKAHVICWIIIGSFVQAQGFSTTVVKEGEDTIIDCGVQTTVEDGYLRWETMNNGIPVDLAYDIRDGKSNCNDRIINCTLYANGSIQLESVSKEDDDRYYRCLRGDEDGYNYYSDHRLLVLSKESPSISQSPTSAIAFKASRKGIIHSYGEPVCEDDVDGNLPVDCYPPSGIIVDRGYETIQCNCTDSDGLMDNVIFPVSRQMSSPPSIETPHRESVSSYHIGKKGVLHGYNAPVCEDDVDGNLPVDCYPPSGIIVDRGYETIQCNCIDSDGLMDNVIFPVSKKTTSSSPSIETPHRESVSSYHIGKKGVLHGYNATVCEDDVDGNLPVVCYPPSGIIVDREYETIQCNCTDSDGLMDSVTFPVTSITHWVHPGWKKAFISLLVISILIILVLICCYLYMKLKKSKAYHPENLAVLKGSKRRKEDDKMAADPEEFNLIESGAKDKQISDLEDEIGKLKATLNNSQTELTQRNEEVSFLTDQLKQKETQETEMKNKLEEQNEKISKIEKELAVKEAENNGLEKRLEDKQQQVGTS